MEIGLTQYILVACLLFAISLYGLFTRRNAVALLMAVELIMLAVALNFTAGTRFLGNPNGQVFAIFIITVAAAEAAVGLSLIIAVYRRQQDVDIDRLTVLKG